MSEKNEQVVTSLKTLLDRVQAYCDQYFFTASSQNIIGGELISPAKRLALRKVQVDCAHLWSLLEKEALIDKVSYDIWLQLAVVFEDFLFFTDYETHFRDYTFSDISFFLELLTSYCAKIELHAKPKTVRKKPEAKKVTTPGA